MRGQLGRYVTRGGVPDPTPNWSTVTWDISDASGTLTSKQITGTNYGITIRLEIEWPILPEDDGASTYQGEVWIKITASEITTVVGTPAGDGFTQVFNNDTFFVAEGEWVSFMSKNPPSGTEDAKTIDAVVTVRNLFDDAILDTFGAQVRD